MVFYQENEVMERYNEVINYLYDQLPYYQRNGPAAYKDNLDNTLQLDEMFGRPHQQFSTIHVAGTNGKGSVSHMLASILHAAGYKTGLYTSPHLKDFRERIRIDGKPVAEQFVADFVNQFLEKNEKINLEPSFFELTVLMAFEYFAREKVDVAIIEVGLGGRLDSTNIIKPELSVITNISLDHTNLLGDTLGKIALEKAGIIKRCVPIVIGETHPQTEMIFEGKAREFQAPIHFADQTFNLGYSMFSTDNKQVFNLRKNDKVVYENLRLDLLGGYQSKNICTVMTAIEQLQKLDWNIPEMAIREGLENVVAKTGLQGRWQILGANPRIVCDTAHNEAGIREIVAQILRTPYKKLHFVIGMVNDKDIASVLVQLPKDAEYYFTKANIPRAMDENQLMKMAAYFNLVGKSYQTVSEALNVAQKNSEPDDMIFIGGSTFVVAEVI